MASNNSTRGGKKPYKMIGAAVLIVAIGLVIVWLKVVRGGEDPASHVATFEAKRGPLTISVLEAGALKAKDPEIIRNNLEGRATIISIIGEGTRVKEGDLLVELDVSTLTDSRIDQVIRVQNAEATFIDANETRKITISQGQSDIEVAQLNHEFAILDRDKYTGKGGELETTRAKTEGDIALSEQELKKNQDYYTWSKRLADEKYLSATQLQADELTMKKSELSLVVAKNSLKLLDEYNAKRQLAKLISDVNQTAAARIGRRPKPGPISPRPMPPSRPGSRSWNARRTSWPRSTTRSRRPRSTPRQRAWWSMRPAAGAVASATTVSRWRTVSRSGSARS